MDMQVEFLNKDSDSGDMIWWKKSKDGCGQELNVCRVRRVMIIIE